MTRELTAALFAAALVLPGAALAMDTDGDGMVSAEEFSAAMPDAPEGTFETIDTNDDGVLDPEEITAAREAGLIPA